jgi:hypothetical protein
VHTVGQTSSAYLPEARDIARFTKYLDNAIFVSRALYSHWSRVKASEWSKALRKELIDDEGLIAVAVSHRKLVV